MALTPEDILKVGQLVSNLTPERFLHRDARRAMLEGLLKHVPCQGPCSALQLNRFFSDTQKHKGKPQKGQVIGQCHINAEAFHTEMPDGTHVFHGMGKVWADKIMASLSDIEQQLYRLKGSEHVYYITREDLFPTDTLWQKSMYYMLSQAIGVPYLSYLWLRLTSDDLWVFCLRRKKEEDNFTDWEREFIYTFGLVAYGARESWYIPGLRKLTDRQQLALYMYAKKLSAKQAALEMNIEVTTYNYYLQEARLRLQEDTNKSFDGIVDTLFNSHRLSDPAE